MDCPYSLYIGAIHTFEGDRSILCGDLTDASHVGGGLGVLQHPLAHAGGVLTRASGDILNIRLGSQLLRQARHPSPLMVR